jgi:superfamily II DNA or RNA helicase
MAKTSYAWQTRGLATANEILEAGGAEISTEAGVGSGKTYFASCIADILLTTGQVEQIIVVTINRRCQRQWWRQMKDLKIPLLRLAGNSGLSKGLPPDVKGYIATYAGMGAFPDLHAAFCGRAKTLVIFDEVHHLNEDESTSWGKAAQTAFGNSAVRLSLSGTYFSSNGAPIPFANMKPKDGSNAKFVYDPQIKYTYGESVADQICRRLVFKPFDGPIEYRREGDQNYKTATFADAIDDSDVGARLWAAIQPVGENCQPNNMLEEMLFRANRRLMDLRAAGHQRAGGLIACDDTNHARKIRQIIEKISGHKAVLVLNDEPGSDKALDSFANGFSPWLVAVRMVTEGVDIPRLRVGVYLARAIGEGGLTFIQFLGRQVRLFKGDEQIPGDPTGESYIFYPADERLVKIATEIEEEIEVAIRSRDDIGCFGPGPGPGPRGRYQAGAVEGEEQDNIVAGDSYTVGEIEVAELLRKKWSNLAEEQIIDMVRFVREARVDPGPQRPASAPPVDDEDDHESLRQKCAKLAKKVALAKNREFKDVHAAANRACGIRDVDTASAAQLKAKMAWLEEQMVVNFDPSEWFEIFGK